MHCICGEEVKVSVAGDGCDERKDTVTADCVKLRVFLNHFQVLIFVVVQELISSINCPWIFLPVLLWEVVLM